MRWKKQRPKSGMVTDKVFAWFPIEIGSTWAHRQYVWLESVERTRNMCNGNCVREWFQFISKQTEERSV